jgi:hypothetical protein
MIVNGIRIQSIEHLEEVIVNMPDNLKEFFRSLYKPTN